MFNSINQRYGLLSKFRIVLALPVLLGLVFLYGPVADAGGKDPYPKLGTFFTTFYYVPNETGYPAEQASVVKDVSGKVISKVNAQFKRDVDIEGTGILRAGPTINYAKRTESEILYRISPKRWGWGVGQCALKPYRTIAVDPSLIPLGTVVYIPAAKGAKLPDGTTHDGIFYAEDIGSRIQHHHVDLFSQEGMSSSAPFEKLGIKTGSFIDVYKVKDPDPKGCQTLEPVFFNPRYAAALAAQMKALTDLADEYAARGMQQELQFVLQRLQALRESWEQFKGIEPIPKLVGWYWQNEKALVEQTMREEEGTPFDERFGNSHYENEFNGMTLERGEVVLTFDDGPSKRYTPVFHEAVMNARVPAAFFELGECIEDNPKLTQGLAKDGLVIANHSYNHPQLTKLSSEEVASQINRTQKIIQTTLGGADSFNNYYQGFFERFFTMPRQVYFPEFFRSPYGSRSERTMKIVNGIVVGQSDLPGGKPQIDTLYHVMWNVDSLDWNDHSPASIEKRVFNELETYGHRGVILMHDIHPQSAEAIQLIIPRLQREGYKIVSVYQMLTEARKKQSEFIPKP